MNIAVVNASVAIGKSQPSQKNSSESLNEFNQTFSSLLDKSSMESSNEQIKDEKEAIEMMDDLASLMVPLPLLNLTQVPKTIEGDMVLGQEPNLELETQHPLMNVLNVQGDSIENSDLSETLEDNLTSDEVNHSSQDEHLSLETQSQISSGIQHDEDKLLSKNLQSMDSISVDKQGDLDENSSLKKVVDKSLNQEKTELQHTKHQEVPLELNSFEDVIKASQELIEDEFELIEESFKGEMELVQESMVVNNGTVFLKDITAHEASLKPMSDMNYVKWDNQSEIMANLRHQISILKENDSTTLQLKLYPQHLGSISVELKMKNGVLSANVLVEQSELKSVIEQEFHQINLEGTKIEQLNVEVNAQSQQQSKSQTATKTSRRFSLEDEPLEEFEMALEEKAHTGYLNLTV